MLPRANRLARRRDFDRVYSRGRPYHSPLVTVYALAREGLGPRFGISVSKKVGGAVQRNRVKRRLREACRPLRESAGSLDLVLVARPPALEADFPVLVSTVAQLVERAAREASRPEGSRRRRDPKT